MHIFLFGGTTEGRKIAEAIAEVNRKWAAWAVESSGLPISAEVYVATAYGASLLPAGPGIRVHVGRLDAEEMRALFENARQQLNPTPDEPNEEMEKSESPKSKGQCRKAERCQTSAPLLVIDATHPYAAVVSENILSACAAEGVRCLRVEREKNGAEKTSASPEGAAFHWVDSIEEAAAWLAVQSAHRPNILITTGSKELAPYTRIPDFAERCYVRALPTMEALEKCQQLGFRRAHLILMQGPFSEEMNVAQLRYADAGYLVTKASGETGGFPEKCEAALALGVEVVCIGRPKEVPIPDAAWYDREKSDAVLRWIRDIGTAVTCGSSQRQWMKIKATQPSRTDSCRYGGRT